MPDGKVQSLATSAVAVVWAGFQLYSSFVILDPLQVRSLHVAFALVLASLLRPFTSTYFPRLTNRTVKGLVEIGLITLIVISITYVTQNYVAISSRIPQVTAVSTLELILGVISVILILEICYRLIGWPLPVLCLIVLAYAAFGEYIQGTFGHKGYSLYQIIDNVYLSAAGIWGIPVKISASYLYLFVLFATLLGVTGMSGFIIDLAKGVGGGIKGGAAQVAVVGSALFGSVSGSPSANVYATGVFTIPMMKKMGFSPVFAGAVEAYASTGGQFVPPIMAATAFIMAEFLGISYLQVIKMAVIPSVLYYCAGGISVYLYSRRNQIAAIPKEERPDVLKLIMKKGFLMIPLLLLIYLLYLGFTATFAVIYAMGGAIVLSFIGKETRLSLKTVVRVLETTSRQAIIIAVPCAAVGVVVGLIAETGVGLGFNSFILGFASNAPSLGLFLVAFLCIFLGAGLPTTPAYIMVAALGVPSLMKLGYSPEASHLFVMYYAILSMITPPVALAAYSASAISGGAPMKIGLTAMSLGVGGFVVPFFFINEPSLLLMSSWVDLFWTVPKVLFGLLLMSALMTGWLFTLINGIERIFLLISIVLINWNIVGIQMIGFALAFCTIAKLIYSFRKRTSHAYGLRT